MSDDEFGQTISLDPEAVRITAGQIEEHRAEIEDLKKLFSSIEESMTRDATVEGRIMPSAQPTIAAMQGVKTIVVGKLAVLAEFLDNAALTLTKTANDQEKAAIDGGSAVEGS